MAQSLCKVYLHVVFHIKTTSPVVKDEHLEQLHSYIGALVNTTGCQVLRVGGPGNHIHALMLFSRIETIAHVVEEMKRNATAADGLRPSLHITKNSHGKAVTACSPLASRRWMRSSTTSRTKRNTIRSRVLRRSIWNFYGYIKLNMMNGMCCPIEIFMMLPLRGEFCETSQTQRASFISRVIPSPRALPMAGGLSPFQGVHAAVRTYNRPEGASSHQPNGNALGIALKGQSSGSPTATPWG